MNANDIREGLRKATIITKLSPKTCGCEPKKVAANLKNDGDSAPLLALFGNVTGVKSGESNFGPWLKFVGSIAAQNLITGEFFRSGAAFLPEVATQLLLPAVESAEGAVQFGFQIDIKKDEASSVGYQYTVKPLLPMETSDPLLLMASEIESNFPVALPAPENVAETETPKGKGKK